MWGDVGIDVRSPCSHKWTYLGGSETAPYVLYRFCSQVIVLTLQLNRCVTSLRLTWGSNNQIAETLHANKPCVLLLNLFSCFAGLCSTRICVSISTHITWSLCARKNVLCIGCGATDEKSLIDLTFSTWITPDRPTDFNKIVFSQMFSFLYILIPIWTVCVSFCTECTFRQQFCVCLTLWYDHSLK